MKRINAGITSMLFILIFASCASNTEFAKRKYLDGYKGKEVEVANSSKKEKKVKAEPEQQEILIQEQSVTEELTASLDNEMPVIASDQANKVLPKVNFTKTFNEEPKPGFKEKMVAAKTVRKINKLNNKPADAKVEGDLIEIILAFLLPPLAVFLHVGLETPFWISLILTCLFWFPGVIYSLLIVLDVIE